ncbi:hypothetical protein VTJ04DRAFT_10256 [Mycothermus thermophilus]|uniref:uncharacterized protein n=1 Tax=Humicola insolens TaxID=85995 RepID=UPI0037445D8A
MKWSRRTGLLIGVFTAVPVVTYLGFVMGFVDCRWSGWLGGWMVYGVAVLRICFYGMDSESSSSAMEGWLLVFVFSLYKDAHPVNVVNVKT